MYSLLTPNNTTIAPTHTVSGSDKLVDLLKNGGSLIDKVYEVLEGTPVANDDVIYLLERLELKKVVEDGVKVDIVDWAYDIVYNKEIYPFNTLAIVDDNSDYRQDPLAMQWTFSDNVRHSILCLDMSGVSYWESTEGLRMISSEDAHVYIHFLRVLNGLDV